MSFMCIYPIQIYLYLLKKSIFSMYFIISKKYFIYTLIIKPPSNTNISNKMKTKHKIIIFVYFSCVIVITMLLFSFVFNTITKRLFGNYPTKTKIYYLEIFLIWLILAYCMYNLRTNVNHYSKNELTNYIEKDGEDESNHIDLYKEIDEFEKFDMIIIIGFFAIFIGSTQHTYKEKLSLLNEDIGIISEAF